MNRYTLIDQGVSAKYKPLIDYQVSTLTSLLDRLGQDISSLKSSGRFSAKGLSGEVQSAGRKALDEVAKATATPPKKLQADLAAVGAPTSLPTLASVAKQRGESDVLTYFRLQELRQHLRTIDPIAQRPVMLDAIASGDEDLLAAVNDTHPALNPIRPDLLAEVRTAYLESKMPPEGRDVLATMRLYGSSLATARREISKLTGIGGESDPIANAATAGVAA